MTIEIEAKAQYIVLAVRADENGGAEAVWGRRSTGDEAWISLDAGHNRSLEKDDYKSIRLMTMAEAARVRDTAQRYNLSNLQIIIGKVAP